MRRHLWVQSDANGANRVGDAQGDPRHAVGPILAHASENDTNGMRDLGGGRARL
jgi:hypothetical protein